MCKVRGAKGRCAKAMRGAPHCARAAWLDARSSELKREGRVGSKKFAGAGCGRRERVSCVTSGKVVVAVTVSWQQSRACSSVLSSVMCSCEGVAVPAAARARNLPTCPYPDLAIPRKLDTAYQCSLEKPGKATVILASLRNPLRPMRARVGVWVQRWANRSRQKPLHTEYYFVVLRSHPCLMTMILTFARRQHVVELTSYSFCNQKNLAS
eukprot:3849974-Pleurochrysis_carterae.AAC.1